MQLGLFRVPSQYELAPPPPPDLQTRTRPRYVPSSMLSAHTEHIATDEVD